MDSSLPEIWQAAASTPFHPAVAKDSQFFIAFLLLLAGIFITGVFALSKLALYRLGKKKDISLTSSTDRSFANIPVLGVPASAVIAWVLPLPLPSEYLL